MELAALIVLSALIGAALFVLAALLFILAALIRAALFVLCILAALVLAALVVFATLVRAALCILTVLIRGPLLLCVGQVQDLQQEDCKVCGWRWAPYPGGPGAMATVWALQVWRCGSRYQSR